MSPEGLPTIAMLPHSGFLSEVSRSLRLAAALTQRGVRVIFATRPGRYTALLDEAGHQVHRLGPDNDPGTEQRFLHAILSMGPRATDFYTDDELRAAVDAEVGFLNHEQPALVVTGFTLSCYLSTRAAGIPLATDHGGCFVPPVLARCLVPAPVNPPDGFGRLPAPVQRWLANRVPARMSGPVKQLNRHARELGVDPLPGMLSLMCGDLTLVTELPSVLGLCDDDLSTWRPRFPFRVRSGTTFRFTGPLFAELDLPIPDEAMDLLNSPDPVVFISPTSVSESFLRDLVGSARSADIKMLVAAGPHHLADLADDDVVVCGLLPNHRVMPLADAAVIMGGQGSVQTAMASGTPFVGLPHHPEQELNVAVAQRLGMAIPMKPADALTPNLGAALGRLIESPQYAASARRAASLYEGVDGAARAADVMLAWLAGRVAQKDSPSIPR